jgi:MFS family permease
MMEWYFFLFFVSGFCSILYELIWLRLTVAQYGVTTAMASIVLYVFMAGMGAGSWAAGKLSRRYGNRLSWFRFACTRRPNSSSAVHRSRFRRNCSSATGCSQTSMAAMPPRQGRTT